MLVLILLSALSLFAETMLSGRIDDMAMISRVTHSSLLKMLSFRRGKHLRLVKGRFYYSSLLPDLLSKDLLLSPGALRNR